MQTILQYFFLDSGSPSSGGEGPSSTTPAPECGRMKIISSSEEFDLSTFSDDALGKFSSNFIHYFKKM
jgi:hypothetical protein